MKNYKLNVESNNVGGYFSTEQLDFLSIIQCETIEELISFINDCKQLKGVIPNDKIELFYTWDLEKSKRYVFKEYQDTLVSHDNYREIKIYNALRRLGIDIESIEDIINIYIKEGKTPYAINKIKEKIKEKYPNNYEEIFEQNHNFISLERDQNKDESLYDEFVLINNNLSMFDTILVGSGNADNIINLFLDGDKKFDFYHVKRDLDFAFKNKKHVRFHSLLTKDACINFFNGRSKEEVKEYLKEYVKRTIDFIRDYNSNHILPDGTPVINAIDLFNEIVSFDVNENGEYVNIWEEKYGITIEDICEIFEYANNPRLEGVAYLYNEPFLENKKRRKKVFEVLKSINNIQPNLIDTLGSQMHITIRESDETIIDCFDDFRKLQNEYGINIQITEFDLSIGQNDVERFVSGKTNVTIEEIYKYKEERINRISEIISNSNVKLSGVSYWSITDKIDSNLERIRSKLLKKGTIKDVKEIMNVCGGLIPTLSPSFDYTIDSNKKMDV